jgi:hypothetical protein
MPIGGNHIISGLVEERAKRTGQVAPEIEHIEAVVNQLPTLKLGRPVSSVAN